MKNKRFCRIFLGLFLCFLFFSGFTYEEEKQRVFDGAGLFTKEETSSLEQLCKEYSLKDKMDYAILTAKDTGKLSTREYAKEFYIENGFGYDKENGDGNLLCIDMEQRHVEMIDRGICVDFVRDEEVETILGEVTPLLGKEDYAQAARVYVKSVHHAFVTNTADSGADAPKGFLFYLICALLALLLSGLVTWLVARGSKSHMTAGFSTYSKKIQVDPRTKRDTFLRTVTTSTPKPKHDSDGGGGSADSSGFGGGGSDF